MELEEKSLTNLFVIMEFEKKYGAIGKVWSKRKSMEPEEKYGAEAKMIIFRHTWRKNVLKFRPRIPGLPHT